MSHPISRPDDLSTSAASATSEPAGLSDGELRQLGITRTLTERFDVGEFRYTSLDDALAQARRQAKATAP